MTVYLYTNIKLDNTEFFGGRSGPKWPWAAVMPSVLR